MEPLKILYEDAHLVICCKPVGVLSEDSESGRCMPQLLREHYLAQGQKNPYIATVHRLDKITGGVMVFSRRREVTGKLTAAVQAYELVKEYVDEIVTVTEDEISTAILALMEKQKVIAEGAGAVAWQPSSSTSSPSRARRSSASSPAATST